ncbi:hypothetical protein [Gloeobacter kilaueensis]|uniref:Uncharacterized protein n=1 Tax=Gloeobacter kilaueensis (strain ATCC BAA-2537 / CCAP 1431/1 / ULC 316 / JS1) TaxID=1183438 RepID=U5QL64_GLOK1|nr:hypothetical protein [Gloeobacter kilaueensis]AGY58319.1 hypothetical protein GKIL_2073 [Gloeobacter kilaueensis JS1]
MPTDVPPLDEDTLLYLRASGDGRLAALKDLIAERFEPLQSLQLVEIVLPESCWPVWAHWLAVEVIDRWRNELLADEALALPAMLAALGLAAQQEEALPLLSRLSETAEGSTLSFELTLRLQAAARQLPQPPQAALAQIEQVVTALADWFAAEDENGCLTQLRANFERIRTVTAASCRQLLIRLGFAGTQVALQQLTTLQAALEALDRQHAEEHEDRLQREQASWRAFATLRNRLAGRGWNLRVGRDDYEATLRALASVYQFKLEAEIFWLSSLIVREVLEPVRLQLAMVARSDRLLAEWQQRCREHSKIGAGASAVLFANYLRSQLDAAQLLQSFETQPGYSLMRWGTLAPSRAAALLDALLAHLQQLCRSLHLRCCLSLLALDDPATHE